MIHSIDCVDLHFAVERKIQPSNQFERCTNYWEDPQFREYFAKLPREFGDSFSPAQLFQISKLKNREISQVSHRVLLGRRHARGPYSMNILEICGDLMWLSDDALCFSFLFIIPNALRSASIPTSQIQPWSENHRSQDWLMRSTAHCAHVIYSHPLSSPNWSAWPAIDHSLGIKFWGLTYGNRS
jgi:hypothetical protein